MKLLFPLLALFPFTAFTLEMQPWFGDVFEFHFLAGYSYSRFNTVQKGSPQLTSPFQANIVSLGLDFSPSQEWSVDADLYLADTTQETFQCQSGAIQARYLWLDDIIGDRVSLSTGASARFTGTPSLKDISCPSHGNVDFEVNFSMGKELETDGSWRWRMWGFGAVGQANRGSPWIRGLLSIETNINEKHKWALYAAGINGYGRHTTVNIDHFFGYAKIREKAIDIGLRYGHRLGVYGTLRFEYIRRVLAKSAPQNVNTWAISYMVPFSL